MRTSNKNRKIKNHTKNINSSNINNKNTNESNGKKFAWQFIQLMFSVFLIFYLTVGLGKPAAEALIYANDVKKAKAPIDWIIFCPLAILGTALWSLLWIWFKKSEKLCTDLWIKMSNL